MFKCKYCEKECKSEHSLKWHIKHYHKDTLPVYVRGNPNPISGINMEELDNLRKIVKTCPICGRTLNEFNADKKFKFTQFTIDHDHTTNQFRGLICQGCNRYLGWYDKHKEKIDEYLNK